MTKQEILNYLNQYRNAGNHIHREAMEMAIDALKKQIPRKPITRKPDKYTNYWTVYKCSCGEEVFEHHRFCPNCGKKIDWGDK